MQGQRGILEFVLDVDLEATASDLVGPTVDQDGQAVFVLRLETPLEHTYLLRPRELLAARLDLQPATRLRNNNNVNNIVS